MNNKEVHFLTTNIVILGLSEVLFEVRNRIGLSGSPIRIQRLGKYKIIILYFYINLMLRLQVQQLDGSFSRYAVTFQGYVGRFLRLKTNGVGTIIRKTTVLDVFLYFFLLLMALGTNETPFCSTIHLGVFSH